MTKKELQRLWAEINHPLAVACLEFSRWTIRIDELDDYNPVPPATVNNIKEFLRGVIDGLESGVTSLGNRHDQEPANPVIEIIPRRSITPQITTISRVRRQQKNIKDSESTKK